MHTRGIVFPILHSRRASAVERDSDSDATKLSPSRSLFLRTCIALGVRLVLSPYDPAKL